MSVVLTVLNEAGSVAGVLDDLLAQDMGACEVLVVDGGSTDGTAAIVQGYGQRHPAIRLVEAPGANISEGRNRGIAAARRDMIAVLDAGVRLKSDWLRLISAPLIRGEADIVAGFFEADPQSDFERAMGATVLPAIEDVNPRTFLPSSRSVAFSRAAWQAAGGYPEWLDYCEDLIFDLRLRQRPEIRFAFEPRATVRFRPRASLAAFWRQYYRYARGDGKADLWRKRHAARYGAYTMLLGVIAGWLAPGGRRHSPAPRLLTAATLLAGAVYCRRPAVRLLRMTRGLPVQRRLRMLALVPIIRLAGDLAKMAGYPAGWRWRLIHRPEAWR